MDQSYVAEMQHNAACAALAVEEERRRPSVLMRPRVFPDGTAWCALYGENLQDGVCGFGDTPDAAARDFDKNWTSQKPGATHDR
jgi:hypothetical protein